MKTTKNHVKQILLNSIAIILVGISLISCEKDLYRLEEQGNSSKRDITFK